VPRVRCLLDIDPELPTDARAASIRKVRRYARLKSPIPAIVSHRFGTVDGAHRLVAARLRGDEYVLAHLGLPQCSFR
jgi:hypothetical protein